MFTKQDNAHAQNMLKLLAKAKMELEGLEILAAAEVMKWFSALAKKIEAEANLPPPPPPKPVEQPAPEPTKEDVKIEKQVLPKSKRK